MFPSGDSGKRLFLLLIHTEGRYEFRLFFYLDEKTYSFSIKENGVTVIVENEAGHGFINLAQTGRVTGSDITGNAFSQEYVTDENGEIKIEGLRVGEYVISEVSNKANEAYILPPDVTVTVHAEKTVVAKFYNELKPVTDIPPGSRNRSVLHFQKEEGGRKE